MSGSSVPDRVRAVKQRVRVSAVVGRVVKLVKRGQEFEGLCPFHHEKTPSFRVVDDKDFYHCFGCGAHGDAFKFVMEREGKSFVEALAIIEGDEGLAAESAVTRESVKQPDRRGGFIDSFKAAAAVWPQGRAARGSIVENWLDARGLDPAATGALDVFRFHPRCPASLWREYEKPEDVRRTAPAMLVPILRVRGGPGERSLHMVGVHITFLSGDGRGKAYFEPWIDRATGELRHPPRRVMWGNMAGGAVLMPGRPVTDGRPAVSAIIDALDAQGLCVVGEGVESTLSFAARNRDVRIACATLSLGNMEGQAQRVTSKGAVPLWRLTGDAERGRPFTFDQPGRVAIGVDADMKPTQPMWVQERKGDLPVRRALTGLERSTHCAGLANWWWRAAGAERVSVSRPPAGHDFNDLDQGKLG